MRNWGRKDRPQREGRVSTMGQIVNSKVPPPIRKR